MLKKCNVTLVCKDSPKTVKQSRFAFPSNEYSQCIVANHFERSNNDKQASVSPLHLLVLKNETILYFKVRNYLT